ncbi:hypothetical protein BC830DRAFT_1131951, partial [Chytriomyces sp. MP71]
MLYLKPNQNHISTHVPKSPSSTLIPRSSRRLNFSARLKVLRVYSCSFCDSIEWHLTAARTERSFVFNPNISRQMTIHFVSATVNVWESQPPLARFRETPDHSCGHHFRRQNPIARNHSRNPFGFQVLVESPLTSSFKGSNFAVNEGSMNRFGSRYGL